MTIESFDSFNSTSGESAARDEKPFAFRDDTSEEGTLEWLNKNFDFLQQESISRLEDYRRWNYFYKGIHWRRTVVRVDDGVQNTSNKKPKMVDNFFQEFIDARVAQMARFGTNFTTVPWNNEIEDQNTAKACDKLLKARADDLDFDKLNRELDKIKYKYGTSHMMVKWDSEVGDDLPGVVKLKEIYGGKIPKKVLKRLGVENPKTGDVVCYPQVPYRVFVDPSYECWKKVVDMYELEWANMYELEADYPDKDIQQNDADKISWNLGVEEIPKPYDQMQIKHYYHPPTKHLPEGAYIKFCRSAILEWKPYPYKHGKLPMVVDRDIEIDKEIWGRPACSQIEQMQRQYNNIASAQARDLGVGSAPKYMVPKGAVDFRTINNEFTVVEYKGAIAPQIVANNPISKDGIVIQDRMERRMSKHMKIYDISRGEVPQGITANSALRFLDEQENQVLADDERKRKRRVLDTYRMMIQVMSQYYSPNDGRAVRAVGKNNAYMIEDMKKADFSKIYDVQFQNTSALPDTKTGKIAAIIDLNMATQTDPVFRREDVVNMLDLGLDETFTEEATYALDSAEQMLQALLQGEEVPEPEMWYDLMTFYTTFFRHIQSFQFIKTTPPDIKQAVYNYIETLEGLLYLKAQTNLKLQQEILMISHYPAFFILPAPVAPLPPEEAQAAEQQGAETGMDASKMKNTQQAVTTAQKAEEDNQIT
jgi:hypothetical protein